MVIVSIALFLKFLEHKVVVGRSTQSVQIVGGVSYKYRCVSDLPEIHARP